MQLLGTTKFTQATTNDPRRNLNIKDEAVYMRWDMRELQAGCCISLSKSKSFLWERIDPTYNQFHNILRLSNVLPNFPFTTSETMGDYYLQAWYIRVASRVVEQLKT